MDLDKQQLTVLERSVDMYIVWCININPVIPLHLRLQRNTRTVSSTIMIAVIAVIVDDTFAVKVSSTIMIEDGGDAIVSN